PPRHPDEPGQLLPPGWARVLAQVLGQGGLHPASSPDRGGPPRDRPLQRSARLALASHHGSASDAPKTWFMTTLPLPAGSSRLGCEPSRIRYGWIRTWT